MNIYVGNLSYDVSDEELGEAFSVFGTVTSARVIRDRYTAVSYTHLTLPTKRIV